MFKLVRDRIPELIKKSGQICNYAEVKNKELFIELLRAKLIEETNEFLNSGSIEELADIKLVIETFAELLCGSKEDLEKTYAAKVDERGKFDNKYIVFLPDQQYQTEQESEQNN